jgi:hypothetical protein
MLSLLGLGVALVAGMAGKHAEYLGLLAEIANMKKALGLP